MKNIARISICVILIFFSIIHFLDYSYYQGYLPVLESTPITVEKVGGNDISNKQYVEGLETAAAESNIELIYINKSIEDNMTMLQYFITSSESTFEQKDKLAATLNYPNLFTSASVSNFTEIEKYTLTSIQLYAVGAETDIGNFIDLISNNTLSVNVIDNKYLLVPPFVNFYTVILILMVYVALLFIFIFLQVSKSKDIMLKKINGYNLSINLTEELKQFNRFLIIPFSVAVILTLILFRFNIKQLIIYTPNFIMFLFKYFLLLNIYFITTFTIVYSTVNLKSLKGHFYGRKFLFFISVIKFGLVILLILSVGQFTNSLNNYLSSEEKYLEVAGTIDYSTLGVYTPNLVIDIQSPVDIEQDYTANMVNFYADTVNQLMGILGYFIIPETGDIDLSNTVNRHYLELNPVTEASDNVIIPDDLSSDKLIYLVPEKYREDNQLLTRLKDVAIAECGSQECLQVIYVNNNTEYKMLGETKQGGSLVDPVVRVVTQETAAEINQFQYLPEDFTSFISSGSYIVKTDKDNPYEVVLPYVELAHLENVIQEAPLLTNQKLQNYIQSRNILIANTILMTTILLSLLIAIYFLDKTVVNNNVKRFSLQYVNGQSEVSILNKQLLKVFGLYLVAIIISQLLPLLNNMIILGGRFKVDDFNTATLSVFVLLLALIIFEISTYKLIFKFDIIDQLNKNINGGSR